MIEPEETGLVLWGGVDFDLTLHSLRNRTCDECAAPATVAIRRLAEQRRRLLCAQHRDAR